MGGGRSYGPSLLKQFLEACSLAILSGSPIPGFGQKLINVSFTGESENSLWKLTTGEKASKITEEKVRTLVSKNDHQFCFDPKHQPETLSPLPTLQAGLSTWLCCRHTHSHATYVSPHITAYLFPETPLRMSSTPHWRYTNLTQGEVQLFL